jgi:hypothetical protein
MPALPGAHLVLIHADFALASFKARFNAGARLDDPRQLQKRRLFQLSLGHTCRTEVVMVAVTGILIGGIARGAGSQGALVRARLPGDHQPFLGSGAFALDPGLHPTPDHLDVHRPFFTVSYR